MNRKSIGKEKTRTRKTTTKSKLEQSFENRHVENNSLNDVEHRTESNQMAETNIEQNNVHSSVIFFAFVKGLVCKFALLSFSICTGKSESINDELVEKNFHADKQNNEIQTMEDDNPNSSIELLNKSSTNERGDNLRLRITPNSVSSISLTLNESDKNNNTSDKSSMNVNNDSDAPEIINDDEETIDKIEAVKNDQDGISFRIKLIGQNQSEWISAKIANRKYPQAVIAFWESHVEFT